MRILTASIGGTHNARVKKTWHGTFEHFCKNLLSQVPETADKAANGWVCGADFDPPYRDSENFVARHLLSLDYDHITDDEYLRIRDHFGPTAHLAYTTWSHTPARPRIRVWLPLSRATSYDEFQAISRRVAADVGIELAARESHVPAQYMFRPAIKPFEEFQSWVNTDGSWIDVDKVLASYENWTDRSQWPHRADGDGVHSEGLAADPRTKPGVVGAFCRAFTITEAIEKYDLPYKPGSSEGRLTYTLGSRPDGAVIYDDDSKLHSHHDTDPARGQCNAYDLVRLHQFGWLDDGLGGATPLAKRPSSQQMAAEALQQPEVRAQLVTDEGFEDLELTDFDWLSDSATDEPAVARSDTKERTLPERIIRASSKCTDQENARRIQRLHKGKLLSIGKTFYCWTGTHWEKDNADTQTTRWLTVLSTIVEKEAVAFRESIEKQGRALTDEEEAAFGKLWQWARECGQDSRINACARLLRSLLGFNAEDLNKAPQLFSCANGTLDLRTGELRPHDPLDFITACAPIAYDPNAEAPRFHQFLREIHRDDEEIISFLQRWLGYCMTGYVNEHVVVFHVGQGGNGKGVTVSLMRAILGLGYYAVANQSLLSLDEKGATPELASLLGKRMVTISETNADMEIRDGFVKKLTGGDALSGRHLFKDPFEFKPTHKLQIFTNNAPTIRSQEQAMWRRIVLLNYHIKYGTEHEVVTGNAHRVKDRNLEETLLLEAPGILRWLVEGAKQWAEQGLNPPASVLAATQAYREDQDPVGAFARERLVVDPAAWTALSGQPESVYPAYQAWISESGSRPLGRPRFARELLRVMPTAIVESRKQGTATVSGFSGFRLTSEGLDD